MEKWGTLLVSGQSLGDPVGGGTTGRVQEAWLGESDDLWTPSGLKAAGPEIDMFSAWGVLRERDMTR